MTQSAKYVDGFVAAVPSDKKDEYKKLAQDVGEIYYEHGALAVIETWGDDVPEGKLTSFPMAVKREANETVVFSWIEWPSKAARDAGNAKVMADPRMRDPGVMRIFDGKRMIYGGFDVIVPAKTAATPVTASSIQPYLFFRGRCEEAITYYQATLGAELLMMMRFKENPDQPGPDKVPTELAERIMHASIRIAGTEIMLSDGMRTGPVNFDCMAMTLSVATEAEADGIFIALAKEGAVEMPMAPAFFAKRFGSLKDKLGVSWMIIVPADA